MVKALSKKLFQEAKKYIPGGVNSPVRSFKAVGGYPIFVNRASGSKIYGECGREFIDYCLSWGVLILGHTHPEVIDALLETVKKGISFGTVTKLEIELAKLIVEAMPSIEQVRLTNSGTEAVMSAIRLARAFTKKNKIIKFSGAYHGHVDYLLVKAGSGQATGGIATSLGVPKDFIRHTIVLPYNNVDKVKEVVKKYQKELAAIIVEPVMGNSGVILPYPEFLPTLRNIADKYNILLIFDEVITGFRLSYKGAQGYFKVRADLTCLGKIIGGGLPVGAFGGRKEIMKLLAPEGEVYHAGTLSGNPLAVAAGITTLRILKEDKLYLDLEEKTKILCQYIKEKGEEFGLKIKINYIGSLFSIFFTSKNVVDYSRAREQNLKLFKRFYSGLLKEGIYFSPSAFEANFLSTAHTKEDLEKTKKAIFRVFKNLRRRD
ncbi:MAG: glutamate-1-semialdehyde 2,1-aminomutase [Candidatus Omnitrophica bacterium]|nr:glutamate-1-semialdehyde 2,1-aminomutase [Candidatus Omnitrophota bacterium]